MGPRVTDIVETIGRRTSSIRRLSTYARNPALYPACLPIRAYWWTGQANFGDELTRFLLPGMGIAPLLKPRTEAHLFGVGSVIELIPPDFDGWVWGSGKMHADVSTDLSNARVLAVRGPLTRDLTGLDASIQVGDPGLLVSTVLKRPAQRGRIAVVPHFTHQAIDEVNDLLGRLGSDGFMVDVTRGPRRVIREIASADAVVSTSLHGLIVADAYGIPAAWALPEPALAGGTFKFLDHESAVRPGRDARRIDLDGIRSREDLQRATIPVEADRIATIQRGLVDSLLALRAGVTERINPLFLVREQLR